MVQRGPGPVTVDLAAGTAVGDGSDTLANIENIEGSSHDDTLTRGAGPNVFWPRGGNDAIDGSGGADWVLFVTGPVMADLSSGSATGEGTDTARDREVVRLQVRRCPNRWR